MKKAAAVTTLAIAGAFTVGTVGAATASGLIHSSDMATGSVNHRIISNGAVHNSELTGHLSALVHRHAQDGARGPKGAPGQDGAVGISNYTVFTSTQNFGPGGIGGTWCGAPDANATDQGWKAVGGGAKLTDDQINNGVVVASTWPHEDPLNPGWNVQVNKPANVGVGDVQVYVVCVKTTD